MTPIAPLIEAFLDETLRVSGPSVGIRATPMPSASSCSSCSLRKD